MTDRLSSRLRSSAQHKYLAPKSARGGKRKSDEDERAAHHPIVVGELFPDEDRPQRREDDALAALHRGDARGAVRVTTVVDVPRLQQKEATEVVAARAVAADRRGVMSGREDDVCELLLAAAQQKEGSGPARHPALVGGVDDRLAVDGEEVRAALLRLVPILPKVRHLRRKGARRTGGAVVADETGAAEGHFIQQTRIRCCRKRCGTAVEGWQRLLPRQVVGGGLCGSGVRPVTVVQRKCRSSGGP